MDDPILFNPDNRLLGSSTGDFGMYGGQSDPLFSVHEARDDAPALNPAAGAASLAGNPGISEIPTQPFAGSGADTSMLPHGDAGSGSLAPNAFLIAPPAPEFAPLHQVALGDVTSPVQSDWSPAATGSGSPIPVLEPGDQAEATAPIDALSEGPLMGTAASLLDDLAAGPVTGAVTGLTEGVLSPVTGAVDGILSTTIGAVEDTLEGLAGSDPLGGVATLVNLVSVSDTFDLAPVVAPLLDTVSDTGLGVVDLLVGEEPITDSLLGNHHDDGLLGGDHILDHPLGL